MYFHVSSVHMPKLHTQSSCFIELLCQWRNKNCYGDHRTVMSVCPNQHLLIANEEEKFYYFCWFHLINFSINTCTPIPHKSCWFKWRIITPVLLQFLNLRFVVPLQVLYLESWAWLEPSRVTDLFLLLLQQGFYPEFLWPPRNLSPPRNTDTLATDSWKDAACPTELSNCQNPQIIILSANKINRCYTIKKVMHLNI